MHARFPFILLVTSLIVLPHTRTLRADPPVTAPAPTAILSDYGSTIIFAQSAAWARDDLFAVGRWDGTVSIFRPNKTAALAPGATEYGPVLVYAGTTPARQGVQLVAAAGPDVFVTSNDDKSLAVWNGKAGWTQSVVEFDKRYGAAVSGASVEAGGMRYLLTGHEQGYVVIWLVDGAVLTRVKDVETRSPNPIPAWAGSPISPMWHVRSIAPWKAGRAVTASEDGDICVLSVPDGRILTRRRYNVGAQRGLNSVAVEGDYVAVANCAVGNKDKNLWVYRLADDAVVPVDAVNLAQKPLGEKDQVFDFSVQLASGSDGLYFFASTQESLLWTGRLVNDRLVTDGNKKVADIGAAFVAYRKPLSMLLIVNHTVQLSAFGLRAVAPAPPAAKTP